MDRQKSVIAVNELTQNQLKQVLDYNPETGVFKWKISISSRAMAGKIAGSCSGRYAYIQIYKKRYASHQLAWLYVYGDLPKNEIDHKDGVTSNNWIDNLREATHAQNLRNIKISRNNKSGFKGVYWKKQSKKWAAQIQFNNTNIHLGYFSTPSDASVAYETAATKLFGEFKRKIT